MSARNRLLSQCVKSEPMQTRRGRRRIQGDDGVVLEKELLMQLPQLLDCRQAPPRGQLAGEDDSGSTRRLIGGTSFGNLDIPRWLRCRRIASSARQQRSTAKGPTAGVAEENSPVPRRQTFHGRPRHVYRQERQASGWRGTSRRMTRTVWVCQVANALAAGNLEVAAAYGHQIVSTSNERRRVVSPAQSSLL